MVGEMLHPGQDGQVRFVQAGGRVVAVRWRRRQQVEVDGPYSLGGQAGSRGGDRAAPVASLREEPLIAQAGHELQKSVRGPGDVPSPLGRRT